MSVLWTNLTFICIFIIFSIQFVWGQNVPEVQTTQGLVRGLVAEDGYYMFKGIPYGLVNIFNPFGPSSPHPAFDGPFEAINDTAICPQFDAFRGTFLGSLDCLHLSVFTPASAVNLSVLVFIHGGGFEVGFYGSEVYNPRFLMRHDIIVVTLNYRLGAFGFMCTDHERVPGNQGLKDQALALRWIHDNIRNFGGDPNRVTLVGNSAGSTSVDLQMIRDHEPKLFNQVIFQSGTSYMPFHIPTARNAPLVLADTLGFQTDDVDAALDFLATMEPRSITFAALRRLLIFGPCVEQSFPNTEAFLIENWMRKDTVPSAYNYNVMIGFNQNEALGLFLSPGQNFSNIVESSLRPTFAIDHEDFQGVSIVRNFFFGDEEINEDQFQGVVDLRSDLSFVYLSMRSIDRWLRSNVAKVFMYLFSYDGGRNVLKMRINTTIEGAAHGDEIGYLWDISYLDDPTTQDQVVVDRMTAMWANFVKYGNPTPDLSELLPVKWEAITPTSPQHYIDIGADLKPGTRPFHERMTFWELFYEINGHLELYMMDF